MNLYYEAYEKMLHYYGEPGKWWPAETSFEIIVGAVLTQNTNWKNVEKALANLRDAGLLDFQSLLGMEQSVLAEHIRPAGFYNVKSVRLQNLLSMIEENYGSVEDLLEDETSSARTALVGVKGVGEETADAILLYAGEHPVFVVDAYTHRIFSRHNMVDEETTYGDIQDTFTGNLERSVELFRGYHGLIIELAKQFCKKTKPLCISCPLAGLNDCQTDGYCDNSF